MISDLEVLRSVTLFDYDPSLSRQNLWLKALPTYLTNKLLSCCYSNSKSGTAYARFSC